MLPFQEAIDSFASNMSAVRGKAQRRQGTECPKVSPPTPSMSGAAEPGQRPQGFGAAQRTQQRRAIAGQQRVVSVAIHHLHDRCRPAHAPEGGPHQRCTRPSTERCQAFVSILTVGGTSPVGGWPCGVERRPLCSPFSHVGCNWHEL